MDKKVISLAELQEMAKGEILEIRDWDGEGTICVRVKRMDLTPILGELRNLPNSLREVAHDVFEGKDPTDPEVQKNLLADPKMVDKTLENLPMFEKTIDTVCASVMVEPTLAEFKDTVPLTLNQKVDIFNWAMRGVKSLENFRK